MATFHQTLSAARNRSGSGGERPLEPMSACGITYPTTELADVARTPDSIVRKAL